MSLFTFLCRLRRCICLPAGTDSPRLLRFQVAQHQSRFPLMPCRWGEQRSLGAWDPERKETLWARFDLLCLSSLRLGVGLVFAPFLVRPSTGQCEELVINVAFGVGHYRQMAVGQRVTEEVTA